MTAETDTFLNHREKPIQDDRGGGGCCRSLHTRNCCAATGVFGLVFIALGILVIAVGKDLILGIVAKKVVIAKGSDMAASWLKPPVQAHLTAYAFSVKNSDAVLLGEKPDLEEVGPFIYRAVTIKDSADSMEWNYEEGKLRYRPRKVYEFVKEGSVGDPDKTQITVPNIPVWTGLHSKRLSTGVTRSIAIDLITTNGLGTPFITVSFSGLLWGYEDELPCLKLDKPFKCKSEDELNPFDRPDDEGDDWESDDGWGSDGDDDWKRKKRLAPAAPAVDVGGQVPSAAAPSCRWQQLESEGDHGACTWDALTKPKAQFVNCSCNWGLFRDRNVTMRKPIEFLTGEMDPAFKGIVTKFDGKPTLDWWKKDSECDRVKGQDASTLPPLIKDDQTLQVFISLMCRTIDLEYERSESYDGLPAYRFVPAENALGAHDDPDDAKRNPDNECYCLKSEGFKCFKSGVYNMEPCKRATHAPLALSYPHFYQADAAYRDAVIGLTPDKEAHQFFIDVNPTLGIPLAIRPRFQLNIVIGKYEGWSTSENMVDELVLPFLWAQDGFSVPSAALKAKIRGGLDKAAKLPLLGAVVFFVIGALLLLIALSYFIWKRRDSTSMDIAK